MYNSWSESGSMEASVAVFETEASTPPIRTRFPPGISSAGMKYLSRELAVKKQAWEYKKQQRYLA